MKTIVLITRENSEKAIFVSVFLCNTLSEANHFCRFVKRLPLAGEDKLFARRITANVEHSLEKYQPFKFDDFVKVDDRLLQFVFRELDAQILAFALNEAKDEVQDKFFRNMSRRAANMLKEDMEFMGPVNETDIENARQVVVDIYDDLALENSRFDEAWIRYKALKENSAKIKEDFKGEKHIVIVFRGEGTSADFVSVFLFDESGSADNFCRYLNSLHQDEGSFFYAKQAEQMIEYETTKPALLSFDQIFENDKKYHGKFIIIREALKKFKPLDILAAFKGIDKQSRTLIMQSLPTKTTDEINEIIKRSDKNYADIISLNETREAQQRILDAVNKAAEKFRQDKLGGGIEIFKA
jgi:hypothetical protein